MTEHTEYADAILPVLKPNEAVDFITNRLRSGKLLNEELSKWFVERSRIEEQYGESLKKLAKQSVNLATSSVMGEFYPSWEAIIKSTNASAESSRILAHRISSEIDGLLTSYTTTSTEWNDMRVDHQSLSSVSKSYIELQEKADKLKKKSSFNSTTASSKYNHAIQAFQDIQSQWEAQAPFVFEKFQIVDENRWQFLKRILTQYQSYISECDQKRISYSEKTLNKILSFEPSDEIKSYSKRAISLGGDPFASNPDIALNPSISNKNTHQSQQHIHFGHFGASADSPSSSMNSSSRDRKFSINSSSQDSQTTPVKQSLRSKMGTILGKSDSKPKTDSKLKRRSLFGLSKVYQHTEEREKTRDRLPSTINESSPPRPPYASTSSFSSHSKKNNNKSSRNDRDDDSQALRYQDSSSTTTPSSNSTIQNHSTEYSTNNQKNNIQNINGPNTNSNISNSVLNPISLSNNVAPNTNSTITSNNTNSQILNQKNPNDPYEALKNINVSTNKEQISNPFQNLSLNSTQLPLQQQQPQQLQQQQQLFQQTQITQPISIQKDQQFLQQNSYTTNQFTQQENHPYQPSQQSQQQQFDSNSNDTQFSPNTQPIKKNNSGIRLDIQKEEIKDLNESDEAAFTAVASSLRENTANVFNRRGSVRNRRRSDLGMNNSGISPLNNNPLPFELHPNNSDLYEGSTILKTSNVNQQTGVTNNYFSSNPTANPTDLYYGTDSTNFNTNTDNTNPAPSAPSSTDTPTFVDKRPPPPASRQSTIQMYGNVNNNNSTSAIGSGGNGFNNHRQSVLTPPNISGPPSSGIGFFENNDAFSIRSSQSESSLAVGGKSGHNYHLPSNLEGLYSSIVEIFNVKLHGNKIINSSIIGEIAFGYNGNSSLDTNNETLKIINSNLANKIAANPSFLAPVTDASTVLADMFSVNVHGLDMLSTAQGKKPIVGLKYLIGNAHTIIPVMLSPSWRFEPSQASLILDYFLPEHVPLETVVLHDLVISACIEGANTSGAQAKPAGTFKREKNRLLWRFESPVILKRGKSERILARFFTDGTAHEGAASSVNPSIEIKFKIENTPVFPSGSETSGFNSLWVQRKLEQTGSDPFADTNGTSAKWENLPANKTIVAGKYTASSSLAES